MTDYILQQNKFVIIATYSKGGGLKKLIAKKGFLSDALKEGYVFAMDENSIELEHWKKHEVEKDAFFTPAQQVWLSFYYKRAGVQYRFFAKDGKALKEIGKHLTSICGVTHDAVTVWKQMLQQWDTLDPFYRNKPDLTFINAQLNTILNLIKNGKQTSNQAARTTADDYRQNI